MDSAIQVILVSREELKPIPGYDGSYYIDPRGWVVNKEYKVLNIYNTKKGVAVELRHNGQREKILVQDLLNITFGGNTHG